MASSAAEVCEPRVMMSAANGMSEEVEHRRGMTVYVSGTISGLSTALPHGDTEVSQEVEIKALREKARWIAGQGSNLIRAQMLWYNNVTGTDAIVNSKSLTDYRRWLDITIDRVQTLTDEVRAINKETGRDIRVVVDLHTPPGGGQELRGEGQNGAVRIVNTLFEDPNHPDWSAAEADHIRRSRAELVQSWEKIATAFRGNEVIYGYDLLNEPGFDPGVQLRKGATVSDGEKIRRNDARVKESNLELWQRLTEKTARAIVSRDPAATLIIEGRRGNHSLRKFEPLDKVEFPNVIYSFHEYARDENNDVSGIQSKHEKRIQQVRNWQLNHDVPIYVGEFDTREGHGGHSGEQLALLDKVAARFEQYGWDWTFHDAGDFGNALEKLDQKFDLNAPGMSQRVRFEAGKISIEGTNRADSVLISQVGSRLSVSVSGLEYERHWFDAAAVSSIEFRGYDGDDVFRNDTTIDSDVRGGKGRDTLIGGSGDDKLRGGADDDTLRGRNGNDRLVGHKGDDFLAGGRGNDTLIGGAGFNTFKDHIKVTLTTRSLRSNSTVSRPSWMAEAMSEESTLSVFASPAVQRYSAVFSGNEVVVMADGEEVAREIASEIQTIAFVGSDASDEFVNHTTITAIADGGAGDDRIEGGSGNDTLRGGGGQDSLHGNDGIDRLFGDSDTDWLYGGSGNDHLHGGSGNDQIVGGAGNDTLEGRDGDDRLEGGDGNDVLYGNNGNDVILGQGGNDALYGETGNDILRGDAGDDFLRGDQGNDRLHGGNGNDRLRGSSGNDRLHGDSGNDTLEGGGGNDHLEGSNGNDVLYGNSGNDVMHGQNGNDSMFGESGDDRMFGGHGNDFLRGDHGNDHLDGGHGNDHLKGEDGHDYLQGNAGSDFVEGGAGNDNVRGGSGVDSLYGNGGNDILSGGDHTDYLFGGRGDDSLYGDDGRDYLDGQSGNDRLDGRWDGWWSRRIRRFRGWIWR